MARSIKRTIDFWFRGNSRDLESASRRSSRALGRVEGSAGRVRGAVAGIGRVAGPALAFFGGREVYDWARGAAEGAKQAELVGESVDKVFGPEGAARLRDGLDETRRALGLTRDEFDRLILPLGDVATGMGMSADEATRMLEQLVPGVGDVAAFRGELEDVPGIMEALESATRGEYDALQRYFPAVSDAAIETAALAASGKDAASELTPLEELTGLLEIVMGGASEKTGELNAAMETGATKANEMRAQTGDLTEQIGDDLVPVMDDLQAVINDQLLPGLATGIDYWSQMVSWSSEAASSSDSFLDAAKRFVSWWVSPGGWLKAMRDGAWATGEVVKQIWGVTQAADGALTSLQKLERASGAATGRTRQGGYRGGTMYHGGGTVPGPKGQAQTVVALGGERFSNAPGAGGNGAAMPGMVVLELDGRQIGAILLPHITEELRRQTGLR